MKLRKLAAVILTICTCALYMLPCFAADAVPPEVDAKAALLIELNSGEILYEKEADTKLYPASLTKIMTCLVALENSTLTEMVTASESAFADLGEFSSTAGLVPGETISMENLLYCMMISSGNEACNIVAQHIAGSTEAYVQMMNDRAAALGCTGTHFMNPHGLHHEDHYTTARDLSIIAQEALKNNTFRTVVSTVTYTLPPTNLSGSRTLTTTNSLMIQTGRYYDSRVNGVKTGFTTPAGRCLVSTAQEGTISLLSVVMGCETRILSSGDLEFASFPETKKLLDFGFSNYTYQTVLTTLYPLAEIPVTNSAGADYVSLAPKEEVTALLPADYVPDEVKISTSLVNDQGVSAPVTAGQELGTVTITYRGTLIGTTPLVAIANVDRAASILPIPQEPDGQTPQEPGAETPIIGEVPQVVQPWLLLLVGLIVLLALMILVALLWQNARQRKIRKKAAARKAAKGVYAD